MPHRYFVLDASLFKKYSLDRRSTSADPITYDDVIMKLHNEGCCNNTCKELWRFMDLLNTVAEREAIICQNWKIIEGYASYLDKMPSEMNYLFSVIISDDDCLHEIDRGNFTSEDFEEIKGTELQSKEIYLDLASKIKNRIIVSTLEDKSSVYSKIPMYKIRKHRISCRCTWEHLDKIKSRSQNVE